MFMFLYSDVGGDGDHHSGLCCSVHTRCRHPLHQMVRLSYYTRTMYTFYPLSTTAGDMSPTVQRRRGLRK